MEFRKFCEYINTLRSYQRIQDNIVPCPKILKAKYNELLEYGKTAFADNNDNIKKWLENKPCVFIHPNTLRRIECKIGNDYEALYYFLMFCKKINHHKRVSEDYVEYLAFLISRSEYPD